MRDLAISILETDGEFSSSVELLTLEVIEYMVLNAIDFNFQVNGEGLYVLTLL